MRELNHLSEIFENYDTFVIDLWGVIHNGIKLNSNAIEAVENLQNYSKKIVFLSNAPRPSLNVKEFLINMKMEEKYLKNIVTSGEAAMSAINQNRFGKIAELKQEIRNFIDYASQTGIKGRLAGNLMQADETLATSVAAGVRLAGFQEISPTLVITEDTIGLELDFNISESIAQEPS